MTCPRLKDRGRTMKESIHEVGFLADQYGCDEDICDRISEFLGDEWKSQPERRQVQVCLPQHCTRIDSESCFYWVGESLRAWQYCVVVDSVDGKTTHSTHASYRDAIDQADMVHGTI